MSPPVFWLPQLLACLTSVGVGAYVWRRRNTHGARALLVVMLATAEWSLLSALHKAVPDLSSKLFLARIQYLGIVTTLPALLVFALQYTGCDRWVTGRNVLLLSVFPVMILLMAWTNPHHGLIWKSITLTSDGSVPIAVYGYGPFFWLWVCFAYGIILICALLLIRMWVVSEPIYRKQIPIMFVGFMVPWAANGLYLLHLSPWPRIDTTPIAFAVTGILLGFGFFWGRILDIVPVVHRTVLENMGDGVIVLDRLNRIAHLNPAARGILDSSHTNVIGQTAAQAFRNIPALAERILETREARMEITLPAEEGRRHYDLDMSVVRDNRGKAAGRLINLHEVTRRKNVEEALRKSEKMYRDLTESIPLAIFQTDREGCVTFANRYALDLLGFESQDLNGDLKFLSFIAPEDQERALANFGKRFEGIPMGETEYTVLNKNGNRVPILLYADLVRQNDGAAGIRGFIIDLSERKKAEKEKSKLEAQLLHAQKMEAVGTLAGGVAHDFNNLLMSIQGHTSLIRLENKGSDFDLEHVEGIEASVRRGANLTKQLLGFAREGKFEVKPLNLNPVLADSARLFGRTRKEIFVHLKPADGLWSVEADRGQMDQVFMNLFINAWHAMPGGGKLFLETENLRLDKRNARLRQLTPGRYVKISVMDEGVGMTKEVQQRIFDPFFTTRKFGTGTGLGLASVYGIVRNHDGHIEVKSAPGKGTTFMLYLPASRQAVIRAVEKNPMIQTGKGTILLVDDEPNVLQVGREMLEAIGYTLLTAGSGPEAIKLYGRNSDMIDLVVLDVVMPEMGGGETFDRLKRLNPDLKVLLASGYRVDGEAAQILNRGCRGFIQKPFDISEISLKLKSLLS